MRAAEVFSDCVEIESRSSTMPRQAALAKTLRHTQQQTLAMSPYYGSSYNNSTTMPLLMILGSWRNSSGCTYHTPTSAHIPPNTHFAIDDRCWRSRNSRCKAQPKKSLTSNHESTVQNRAATGRMRSDLPLSWLFSNRIAR